MPFVSYVVNEIIRLYPKTEYLGWYINPSDF